MHKTMILLPLAVLILSSANAEEARDQVRSDILKSLDEAVQARQVTIDELRDAVQVVNSERAKRGDENVSDSAESKIAEAKAIGNISVSVADVEIAKIQAKEKIVKVILDAKESASSDMSPEKMENKKASAVKKIAKAVSKVEVAKANATRTIVEATKNVEISKIQKRDPVLDDASALKIAKNVSAVKIAKSVSAVEITKAVSDVEISKALLDKNVNLTLDEKYKDLTLDEIKSKAKAEISTIAAKQEVSNAKAMADIAKIVSFVEIAEAIHNKEQTKVKKSKSKNSIETYSREFIIFHTK